MRLGTFAQRLKYLLFNAKLDSDVQVYLDTKDGLEPAEVNLQCDPDGNYKVVISEEIPF